MDKNSNTPEPVEEKNFLQRNAPFVALAALLLFIAVSVLGTIMVVRREARYVPPVVKVEELPGPKNKLSDRSKQQLVETVKDNPRILAVAVTASRYGKNENPFIFVWTARADVQKVYETIVSDIQKRQSSDEAMSSDDVQREAMKDPVRSARLLRNSEEAKMGLIKCIPLADATLVNESLRTIATGICYATIPPFNSKPAMAIIVLTDTPLTNYSELAEMRRILLALQIDIYNRDFQGRETWAHP